MYAVAAFAALLLMPRLQGDLIARHLAEKCDQFCGVFESLQAVANSVGELSPQHGLALLGHPDLVQ